MNFTKRFEEIYDFLQAYEFLYQKEFLKKYPSPYPSEIVPWIEELKSFDLDSLAQLESFPHEDKVQAPKFKSFLKKIRTLSEIQEKKVVSAKLPKDLEKKLNSKKTHEISIIKNILDNDLNINQILDIGGGVGNLSSALAFNSQLNCLCVDANNVLIKKGEKKKIENVEFIHKEFHSQVQLNLKQKEMETTIIGLHGCGELSSDIIKYFSKEKIKGLLNCGCCYHKITNSPYISKKSESKRLNFTTNALHLASRCGKIISKSDLEKRFSFKAYRYSLHYYVNDHFGYSFYSVGNAKKQDFLDSFSKYAKKFHKGDEFKKISDIDLESFFNSKVTKNKVNENILADMIRLFLGRLIELYIILDRVLFLEEQGHETKLFQIFDRKLSPRNLLISAQSNI